MEKYDIVLESVSAKQEQLNAKVQEFYMNLVNSGLLTAVLDLANGFMDIVNTGDSLVGKLMLVTATSIGLSIALKALKATKLGGTISAWIGMLMSMSTAEDITAMKAITLKGALDLLKAHPVIFALSILTAVVTAGVIAFDALNVSLEEQHEKAQTLQSEYQSLASELETVNSELETTQQRIDELQKKAKEGSISPVEKEELELLQKTNAELEKRQYWLQEDAKNKKAEVTEEASKAWDKDFNKTGEYQSRYDYQTRSQRGYEYKVYDSITETEHIKEQIKYYGELEQQIDKLISKKGKGSNIELLNKLQAEQKEVQDYLKETGAKIQTEYLDAYEVDDETKESWTALRDKIGNVLDIAYDTSGIIDGVADASNNLEAVTFDDVFSDYASHIQSLSERYEILTKAQEEYNEYGNITASTMKKIIDNNLLEYLTAENGQLQFNTQALQDKANATQNDAIASLQSALMTDLQSIALGNYQDAIEQTETNSANAQLIAFQTELSKTTDQALTTAGAISTLNASLGTDYKFSDKQKEQADKVVANYNAMVTKVKSLSTNLSSGSYRSKSSGSSSSKSKKEWWETALSDLKDSFEANDITLNAYIKGLENILGKVQKGSEGWKKITEELQKAKLDNIENQFDRGEITINEYIAKLEELRKSYKKNTEGYKELTETINDAKYDKFANQYERGEITVDKYISKLKSLQKQYKKGSEEYKKLADEIDEIKLEKTEKYLDKLEVRLDKFDQKIDELGEVNTDKESVKYAELLSKKYTQIKKDISSIRKQLKDTNLTQKQREALQERLNKLLVDEVDIRDEIEDQVREYYENQKEQAEQQAELNRKEILYQKELELYGKKGKELVEWETNQKIKAIEEQIELREAEKEALDEINEREQLENDLLEAKLKLQNALNNKTTKILKKQADGTWQFEYSANLADVKSAKEEMANAEKALADFDWEQGVQQLQDEADRLADEMEDLNAKYEEAEFWADREYEQTMNGIDKAYGDIDTLVEQWMKTYGGDITKLTEAYQSVVSANNKLEDAIVKLTSALESNYETIGVNSVSSVDGVKSISTSGNIVSNGLMLAYNKEQALRMVDVTKFGGYISNKAVGSRVNTNNVGSTIINKVECVFPNITSTDGLQQAILQLPRLALQNK